MASPYHKKAKLFVEQIIAEEDQDGNPIIAIPLQVCAEFINVCTRAIVGKPLSITDAVKAIQKYSDFLKIPIIYPHSTQLRSFLALLKSTTSPKRVFDIFLAAALRDNDIEGLYTANVTDFKDFDFLKVENPLT